MDNKICSSLTQMESRECKTSVTSEDNLGKTGIDKSTSSKNILRIWTPKTNNYSANNPFNPSSYI